MPIFALFQKWKTNVTHESDHNGIELNNLLYLSYCSSNEVASNIEGPSGKLNLSEQRQNPIEYQFSIILRNQYK